MSGRANCPGDTLTMSTGHSRDVPPGTSFSINGLARLSRSVRHDRDIDRDNDRDTGGCARFVVQAPVESGAGNEKGESDDGQ